MATSQQSVYGNRFLKRQQLPHFRLRPVELRLRHSLHLQPPAARKFSRESGAEVLPRRPASSPPASLPAESVRAVRNCLADVMLPGTAKISRPDSRASLTVISDPEYSAASTTDNTQRHSGNNSISNRKILGRWWCAERKFRNNRAIFFH